MDFILLQDLVSCTLKKRNNMKKISLLMIIALSLHAGDFYYEYGKKVMISKSYENRDHNGIKYYENSMGQKIGVKDEIIIKCKENIPCQNGLKKYNITSVGRLSDTMYLVKVPKGKNIFTLSQKLYNDKSIEFAHPNFIKKRTRR